MANSEHLEILKNGVDTWNKWRSEHHTIIPDLDDAYLSNADLSNADLEGAKLSRANLSNAKLSRVNLCSAILCNAILKDVKLNGADLSGANFSGADLSSANLSHASLFFANFSSTNLSHADLSYADLSRTDLSFADLNIADLNNASLGGANLCDANLVEVDLSSANLTGADLSRANLSGANLCSTILIETNFSFAKLIGCMVYGISAWDIKLIDTKQNGLIITHEDQPIITVDNLEVAQFIYLLLNNQKIRDVINTVANKAVLILGRFGERKVILDSIADELRNRDYLPIMFDFEKPIDRNFRETVQTLAGLSKFVIADLTDPKSTPLESLAIFYNYKIPFLPLIQEGQVPFSMFDDYKLEIGYIPPVQYKDLDELKSIFERQILAPAEKKHQQIRAAKNS